MGPRFVLGRENLPCVAEVVNRSLKADCTDIYIECQIQKGFIQRLSGTLEHTYNLSYLIDQARIKQRSLTVTLLDLKNAFGEVDHMLIKTTLGYHQIPDFASDIILNIYTMTFTRQY